MESELTYHHCQTKSSCYYDLEWLLVICYFVGRNLRYVANNECICEKTLRRNGVLI